MQWSSIAFAAPFLLYVVYGVWLRVGRGPANGCWVRSATQSDVAEAITLLLAAARFGIAGAPEALQRMLPLVFSREQGGAARIVYMVTLP